MIKENNINIIGVTGISGSGKSTISRLLVENIPDTLLIVLDNYYLNEREQIEKNGFVNYDHPFSVDYKLFNKNIFELNNNGYTNIPIYDFKVRNRIGYEKIEFKKNIIIDGLFVAFLSNILFRKTIYIDVDPDIALIRRIKRDIELRNRKLEDILYQYEHDVKPMSEKYIKVFKKYADLVISNNYKIPDSHFIIKLLDDNTL